jgi:hypothetical protein
MSKLSYVLTTLCFSITLSACSATNSQTALNNGATQWDFDHNLQFRYTKLSTIAYQLEVIPNGRVKFDRLAAFLLRKSFIICASYNYNIEIIQGIEGFDDKRAMPNYITPSLIAKIKCKQDQPN